MKINYILFFNLNAKCSIIEVIVIPKILQQRLIVMERGVTA